MNISDQLAVQKIIAAVDTYRASDLHLSVGNPPMLRVDGNLVAMPETSILTPDFIKHTVFSWLSAAEREALEQHKHLTTTVTMSNKRRFLLSAFYQQGNLSATMRLLAEQVPRLEELGLSPSVKTLAEINSGLVLIIGPYGSGRAMTAAGIIEHRNQTRQQHIVTIEQHTEYLFQDKQCVIDQREIGKDVVSAAEGLKAALEENIDAILISPLEDSEAYEQVLKVAQSGMAVYAIMPAISEISALSNVISSVEGEAQEQRRQDLGQVLGGIINQRLVREQGSSILVAGVVIPNDALRTVLRTRNLQQLDTFLANSRDEQVQNIDRALQQAVNEGRVSREGALPNALHPEILTL